MRDLKYKTIYASLYINNFSCAKEILKVTKKILKVTFPHSFYAFLLPIFYPTLECAIG